MLTALKHKVATIRDNHIHRILPDRLGEKVFCVAYNKTGTTSLGNALKMLGYKHTSFNSAIYQKYLKHDFQACLTFARKFDAFDDDPWLRVDMIPLLDSTFPGSKFIHLTRKEDEWIESLKNWSAIYKRPITDPEKEIRLYRAHTAFINRFFKDRKDFMSFDIKDPQGMKKLADFLGKEAPQAHFPHKNKTVSAK